MPDKPRLSERLATLPKNTVCYRIQIWLDGTQMTSETIYSPTDVVQRARALSMRDENREAVILDERGRLAAWFGWSSEADDATPRIRANHIARADEKLAEALTAQDPTCFGAEA